MRLRYLSHRRPAKAQASLRIRAVSPEPSLFAYLKYGSRLTFRPKIRHLATVGDCACAFEERVYERRNLMRWLKCERTMIKSWYAPSHEVMVIFVFCKRILQTRMGIHPVGIDVWFLVGPFVYFMWANSEGSGETARMRRFAWAFAGRLCDKYHNLMSWPNYNQSPYPVHDIKSCIKWGRTSWSGLLQ